MPFDAPVMIATFPSSKPMTSISFSGVTAASCHPRMFALHPRMFALHPRVG
jgi:hypothetical protein